jgi:hypothetical protein
MTTFKISYLQPGDPGSESARCTNCEEPATRGNPIIRFRRPGNDEVILSHAECPSYQDFLREQRELASRNASVWEFAASNRYVSPIATPPVSSPVQKTHPIMKTPSVKPIVHTEAVSSYDEDDTGASNPPSK